MADKKKASASGRGKHVRAYTLLWFAWLPWKLAVNDNPHRVLDAHRANRSR